MACTVIGALYIPQTAATEKKGNADKPHALQYVTQSKKARPETGEPSEETFAQIKRPKENTYSSHVVHGDCQKQGAAAKTSSLTTVFPRRHTCKANTENVNEWPDRKNCKANTGKVIAPSDSIEQTANQTVT